MDTQIITLIEALSGIRQPVAVGEGEMLAAAGLFCPRPNIVGNLIGAIQAYVRQHELGAVAAEASYTVDGGPRSRWSSGADALGLSLVRREHAGAQQIAPDLAVEVIAPTDRCDEVSQKVADYLRFGVRLVWMIDPAARTVRVHTSGQPLGYSLRLGDTLTGDPVIPSWSMRVADLFTDD